MKIRAIRSARAVALSLVGAALLAACDAEPEAETVEAEPTTEVAEEPAYADWDRDGDTELDRDELPEWVDRTAPHGAWETDVESEWDADNMGERMLVIWDTDRDTVVTEEEWAAQIDMWYVVDGDPGYGTWTDWDMDGDSELDADEIAEALERYGIFNAADVDANAVLDPVEFDTWLFEVVDTDDDGVIDETEWEAFAEIYGFES